MILKILNVYLNKYVYKIHEKYRIEISKRFVDRFLSLKDIMRKKIFIFFEIIDKLVAKENKETLFITSKYLT